MPSGLSAKGRHFLSVIFISSDVHTVNSKALGNSSEKQASAIAIIMQTTAGVDEKIYLNKKRIHSIEINMILWEWINRTNTLGKAFFI